MKRILACFLSSLFLLTTGEARTFPSSGKKLHYQFSKQQIRFDGQKKAGDRGRLRCYDLQKDSMWTVDRPWASSRTERNGLPLDSNYVFNLDISSWTFGPKLTLILEMKVEKRGEEAFGPIWLCSHKDAQDKGYYPFGADEDHVLYFKGKTSPKDTSVLTQRFRLSGKSDKYSTVILMIDRTDGKHTFYQSDTAVFWYMDEARRTVADYDRLVLRQCKKGGIRELALYNRLLTPKEIEAFYWGQNTLSSAKHPPIRKPVPLVNNVQPLEGVVIAGVQGWTQKDIYAILFCIALAVISLFLNLFVRKRRPIGYRGKGWVVLVLVLTLVISQLFTHSPFQAAHVLVITGIVCYIIVAFGPVPGRFGGSAILEFLASFRQPFHYTFQLFGKASDMDSSSSSTPGHTVTTKTEVSHYDQSGRYLGSDTKYGTEFVGGDTSGSFWTWLLIAVCVCVAMIVVSAVSQTAFILIPLFVLVRFVLNLWRNSI